MSAFKDQRILVIGGSSGIGLATAHAFVKAEGDVTIASRSSNNLKAAAEIIQSDAGRKVTTSEFDVQDLGFVQAWFSERPPWNHVIVTGTQTKTGSVRELALTQAYEAMFSKFWGAYHVAHSACIDRSGSLTLVSGYLSNRPNRHTVLQGSINAAIDALARGLALDLAPIRVNSVSPGLINTPLWGGLTESERAEVFENRASLLPVQRVGEPNDIAQAILFLAGNKYATGTALLVDGGATLV